MSDDLVVRDRWLTFAREVVSLADQSGFMPYDEHVLPLARAYLAVVAERDAWRRLFNEGSAFMGGHELQGVALEELKDIRNQARILQHGR